MTHLRIEKIGAFGLDICSCGRSDCRRWHDDALLVAAFSGPRKRDLAAMAARLRAAEERPA
jgi:hypothetical protein